MALFDKILSKKNKSQLKAYNPIVTLARPPKLKGESHYTFLAKAIL